MQISVLTIYISSVQYPHVARGYNIGHHSLRLNCVKYLSNHWELCDVSDSHFSLLKIDLRVFSLQVASIVLKIFSTSTIPVHLQERMEATQQPGTATPGIRPLLRKQNKGNKDLHWIVQYMDFWGIQGGKQNKTKQCSDLSCSKFISNITREDLLHDATRMIMDSPRSNPPMGT